MVLQICIPWDKQTLTFELSNYVTEGNKTPGGITTSTDLFLIMYGFFKALTVPHSLQPNDEENNSSWHAEQQLQNKPVIRTLKIMTLKFNTKHAWCVWLKISLSYRIVLLLNDKWSTLGWVGGWGLLLYVCASIVTST